MASPRKGRPRIKPASPASLRYLQQIKEARKREHLHSKGTDTAYRGRVKRGKEFLLSLVASIRESRADVTENDGHQLLDVGQLEAAFGDPPNSHLASGPWHSNYS
jgi:hypothetical protein